VTLNGLIYATTVPELYDWLHLIRSTFSPTSAYQQSPGDQGYLALLYSQPTSDVQSWDGVAAGEVKGQINLQMFVRPLDGSARSTLNRDRITRNGGTSPGPTALPYSVRLSAKDPRVYASPQQVKDVSGVHSALTSGVAKNRGDYESPLDILLVVGSTAPSAPNNVFVLKGFGVDMTITLEAAKANRVYRWYGNDRVLMVTDSTGGPDAPPALRMDLVKFATKVTRPMVPAQINPPTKPFTSSYQYSCAYSLGAGSRMFWYEAFA
jgi:hypothetical protein